VLLDVGWQADGRDLGDPVVERDIDVRPAPVTRMGAC
jgi:hypothetical protein